ncbi:50S ribosomal protein L3 [Criblamydia sequanensis]|uniref:Large ribosomal subunit protein uL3 n=1 Tax=Candidatus Criblamydia sequanensis CRIB-18 TaxID=1437425 RepID=A0A090D0F0_9BACT|nr:50S ribosomal protein L3 [Criblamydia sequanensis CRIB-18]
MALKLMGRKRGMVQLFDDAGNAVPCTAIELSKNVVTQIKTEETDGYVAVQLGFEEVIAKDSRTKEKRTKKPQRGHFLKSGVQPVKNLSESRLEKVEDIQLGQEFGVEVFNEIKHVDVTGISKGKGFQGVMKLHNYSGGPASHGASQFHRSRGSQGMRSTPGRCLPGIPQASHMGDRKVTVQNLRVVEVLPEDNVLLVEGAIPGPVNGLVYITAAEKKKSKAA